MLGKRVATLVTSIALGTSVLVGGAAPASADNIYRSETITQQEIGVLGQEIYKTPQVTITVGAHYPSTLPTPPSLEVTTTPFRKVELVHPDAGGESLSAYLMIYVTDAVDPTKLVPIGPVPIPLDGDRTCIFFQGLEIYNPGGCALFLNGSTPLDDEINDILDDLPLP
jgi:hypothetical protein